MPIGFDLTVNIPLLMMLIGLLMNSVRQTTMMQQTLDFLKENQRKHEERLDKHDTRLDEHDRRLDRHDIRLEHIEVKK